MRAFFELCRNDRSALESVVATGKNVGQFRRAQALLWLDEGRCIQDVAHLLRVSRRTIYNWTGQFRTDKNVSPILRLTDAPCSGRPRTARGIIDPLIDLIIDSDPRDYGYSSSVWTSELLVRYLSDRCGIRVSSRSVSYALERLGIRWKVPRYDLARRSPNWRQAKGGLIRGLYGRKRTVILMPDETIITETPPLRGCYGRSGQQVRVPISGNHARRVLHGVISIRSGDVLLLITDIWDELTHRYFLKMIRSHWRGWHIVLFEDRGKPHTAEGSLGLADEMKIEIRLLPVATPELNAMDHLWKSVKGRALANSPVKNTETAANEACRYILSMTRHQRLKAAGILSGSFWLAESGGCLKNKTI